MTRDDAKQLLPIIQAFADGKTVQYGPCHGLNTWVDATHPTFDTLGTQWRIKPREPREFYVRIWKDDGKEKVGAAFSPEEFKDQSSCKPAVSYFVKVREVLE